MTDARQQPEQRYEVSLFIGPCSEDAATDLADAILDLDEARRVYGGGVGIKVVHDAVTAPEQSAAEHAATVRRRLVPKWAWEAGTEREYVSDANAALDALTALAERAEEAEKALAEVTTAYEAAVTDHARAEQLEAEVTRLRVEIEDYMLWEPGRAGHAAAHERLRAALAEDTP